jgi:putative spermidine/putrescine transport system permease protein
VTAGVRAPTAGLSSYWLLVLPLLAFLVLLFVLPIGQVLWISLSEPSLGLQNYRHLVTSGSIHRMLWTTFRVCALTTALSLVLGYAVAYAMVHASPRHRTWMLLFILVPFWVSVLVRAFSWLMLLHDGGILNSFLESQGIITEPIHLVRNEVGVLIGMTHYMIPYAVLPLYATMRGIDRQYVMAARGLGAGSFEAFRRVYLPMSLPGIVGAGVLVFILTLGFFVTPAILGGGKTVMIAEYVSVQILNIARWGVGAMLAVVLLVSVFALLGLMGRFVDMRTLFGAR